jgi:hypothetical protein
VFCGSINVLSWVKSSGMSGWLYTDITAYDFSGDGGVIITYINTAMLKTNKIINPSRLYINLRFMFFTVEGFGRICFGKL